MVKIQDDLVRVEFLVDYNEKLLDDFFAGDETVLEKIVFNHLDIMTYFIENEELKVLNLDQSNMLKSEELFEIKRLYLDGLTPDNKVTQNTLSDYYNKLGQEVKNVISDKTTFADIRELLESGSTFILDE